jgi:hypothetical protein
VTFSLMIPLRSLYRYEIIIAKYVCQIFLNMDWHIVGKFTFPKYNNTNELIIKNKMNQIYFGWKVALKKIIWQSLTNILISFYNVTVFWVLNSYVIDFKGMVASYLLKGFRKIARPCSNVYYVQCVYITIDGVGNYILVQRWPLFLYDVILCTV